MFKVNNISSVPTANFEDVTAGWDKIRQSRRYVKCSINTVEIIIIVLQAFF